MPTIFAVSSGMPPAAIAVLRISGPDAFAVSRLLAGELPGARIASLRSLRDPATGALLDLALILCFPAPATATGEDLVELHLHGGRAVVAAVEHVLADQPSMRRAEPGEFTRRALANGRIDLTEAEGLGDLLMAETEGQRRAALSAADGTLRRRVETWRSRVLTLAAMIEASLDHADEGDVADDGIDAHVAQDALILGREIAEVVAQPTVERLRDGIRITLGGPPNSGKSTLFNALVERDAAIVSPIAGTTRDRIEAAVTRGGIAWRITDTAGLAEATDDPVEMIGIARARVAMMETDILLWLDSKAPPTGPAHVLWVQACADLPGRDHLLPGRDIMVSARTGVGITAVWDRVVDHARHLLPAPDAIAINQRQHDLLSEAAIALSHAGVAADPILIAENLRLARHAFDAITGAAGVEAMLDALFGTFCIGK